MAMTRWPWITVGLVILSAGPLGREVYPAFWRATGSLDVAARDLHLWSDPSLDCSRGMGDPPVNQCPPPQGCKIDGELSG
jgi:hypothetical protein